MNKREADTILLACKKHGVYLTMRKEGSVYMVTFNNRLEITSFRGAKLITNGLVIEAKHKKDNKKHIIKEGPSPYIKPTYYPKRKIRPDNGISFSERRRL